MSVKNDPMSALREITSKKQPVIKAESSDKIYSRFKYFKPDLTLDTQSIAEQSFLEEQMKKDNSNSKATQQRGQRQGSAKGTGFQQIKAEDIWNRVSPQTRLPSRDSYNPVAHSTQNYFLSKSKEKAESQDTYNLIKNRLEKGCQFFSEESYYDALLSFQQSESLIEKNCNLDKKVPFDLVFLTFYNSIATNYKLKNLQEALTYTNNQMINMLLSKEYRNGSKRSNYNFNNAQDQIDYLKKKSQNSQFNKFKCKMLLQACIINSESEKHKDALIYAKQAATIAFKLITQSLVICYKIFLRYKEVETSNKIDILKRIAKTDLMNSSGQFEQGGIYGFKNTGETAKKQERLETQDSKSSITSNTSIIQTDIATAPSYNDPLIPMNSGNISYIEKLIPILEEIVNKIVHPNSPPSNSNLSRLLFYLRRQMSNHDVPEMDLNNLYEELPDNHFLYTSNIMGIIQLKPIKPSMIVESKDLFEEVSADKIIEQILLVVTSLYALSTEFRFWDDNIEKQDESEEKVNAQKVNKSISKVMKEYLPKTELRIASELWIGRSLQFAYVYLPHDSPLADQIFSIYSRLYSPTKFSIPEDDESEQDLRYLYPAKGVPRSNQQFFIPLIKTNQKYDLQSLLTLDKDLTEKFMCQLRGIQIIDHNCKYYSPLKKNYAIEIQLPQEQFNKKTSNTQLQKIYGNSNIPKTIGINPKARKPLRSPSDRQGSAQRFRFPGAHSADHHHQPQNTSFELINGPRPTPSVRAGSSGPVSSGQMFQKREEIPKISLKKNNFFSSPEQPKPGSSQSDPSRRVPSGHIRQGGQTGIKKPEHLEQLNQHNDHSFDRVRTSQEQRQLQGGGSNSSNRNANGKPNKLSVSQEGFRKNLETKHYINSSNLNIKNHHPQPHNKGKQGRPPSPKTLDAQSFNWADSRKVDININNNISVIINNSPNIEAKIQLPTNISDDPHTLTQIQQKSNSTKSPGTFKGDPLNFMPTKANGVVPKPPKAEGDRFRRQAKPQKPPAPEINASGGGDRPFRRKMFKGGDNSIGSRNSSKENDKSNYSDNSIENQNNNKNITVNILDALIEEKCKDKANNEKLTATNTAIPSSNKHSKSGGMPPKMPLKAFERVKRPSSRTKLDASRISPSNQNNKDLSFKFEDSELLDVTTPSTNVNQTAIIESSNNENSFLNYSQQRIKLDNSADHQYQNPLDMSLNKPPKSGDKKIRIRRVKPTDHRQVL